MNNRMMEALTGAEPMTFAALRMHGYDVQNYGQGMLTDQAREMLRGVPTPERWTPDFLAVRPAVVGLPRWPERRRGKYAFLVDAKFRFGDTNNQSVEMRSLLAAATFGMDVYYVCSRRMDGGGDYRDFGVIDHGQVLAGRHTPCCAACNHTLKTSTDPMRELPEHCPSQPRNRKASGTPFVYFPAADLHQLSSYIFDNLAMGHDRKAAA